jgi:magnesium chelatase family protein
MRSSIPARARALVTKYQTRIPGPLLDRIDIHVEVPRVDYEKLNGDRVGEIRQFCRLPDEGQTLMRAVMAQLNLSARTYNRILKLAWTIADLAGLVLC